MSFSVVVPFRDYTIPVNVERERAYATTYTSGLLKINATDYLLINATDKLILQDTTGTSIKSPVVVVSFRDYTIPVPERDTDG